MIVVTGSLEDPRAAEVSAHARSVGAVTVVNPAVGSEQIASLRVALHSLPSIRAAIVTPVDSPGASSEIVAALIAAAARGCPVAVPTFRGRRGHPVAFGREAIPHLLAGDLPEGARTVIRRFEADLEEIAFEESDVLLDIDTPEDYRILREGV